MSNKDLEKLEKFTYERLAIYTPQFDIHSFKFIRYDTGVYVVEITGNMNSKEAICINWFEAQGIFVHVKGFMVAKYTIFLPERVVEKNLNIHQPF